MTTLRKLFDDLGLNISTLSHFLSDAEILYNSESHSKEELLNYFVSSQFKDDVSSLESKVKMFTNYFGLDVKFAAFFADQSADLHLDIFPLVH